MKHKVKVTVIDKKLYPELQRQYCASQFTYNNMRMIEDMRGMIIALQGTVDELKAKIEAIQGNEASLFDPTDDSTNAAEKPLGAVGTGEKPAGVNPAGKPLGAVAGAIAGEK